MFIYSFLWFKSNPPTNLEADRRAMEDDLPWEPTGPLPIVAKGAQHEPRHPRDCKVKCPRLQEITAQNSTEVVAVRYRKWKTFVSMSVGIVCMKASAAIRFTNACIAMIHLTVVMIHLPLRSICSQLWCPFGFDFTRPIPSVKEYHCQESSQNGLCEAQGFCPKDRPDLS